ncbi:hypothetical protein V2S66_30895 [Streptomyces sp. V4-01]|uniref:Uncharacterized protein n=1 Tax=Actinacidiphila polyblastidii TaxID=3110430 RepID=A0ABU7PMA6_9ACTN|nr:hypothetical protein [Streptomyces sp. V4-01]
MAFDDVAAPASKKTGRDIARVTPDDEAWIAAEIAAGTPGSDAFRRPRARTGSSARHVSGVGSVCDEAAEDG